MPTLSVKRVYETPSPHDGMRVLVDRLWPRGLTKEKAAVDLWLKEIAPSPTLRTWFAHRDDRFEEFAEKYRHELAHNPAVAELRALVKKRKVTILYGAHDPAINHAVVLEAFVSA